MRLEIDVFGDKQLARDLLRLGDRIEDATPAFREMLTKLAGIEREQFASEGGRGSGGWAPLAASTLATKRANGLDEHILVATGRLRASLTGVAPGGDARREVHPTEMVFGTNVPYARYHQLGTIRIPRRRFLELTELDRREAFVKVLQRFYMTREP